METRDVGFLHESEFMRRAAATSQTVYEYAQGLDFDLSTIYKAASKVGISDADLNDLQHADSGVRYWAVQALMQPDHEGNLILSPSQVTALEAVLHDPSPAVALAAAEALTLADELNAEAIKVIAHYLQMNRELTTVLNAAMTAKRIGELARPLIPVIEKEYTHYRGGVWNRYKNWYYPMFIGMAFDQIKINCGIEVDLTR